MNMFKFHILLWRFLFFHLTPQAWFYLFQVSCLVLVNILIIFFHFIFLRWTSIIILSKHPELFFFIYLGHRLETGFCWIISVCFSFTCDPVLPMLVGMFVRFYFTSPWLSPAGLPNLGITANSYSHVSCVIGRWVCAHTGYPTLVERGLFPKNSFNGSAIMGCLQLWFPAAGRWV